MKFNLWFPLSGATAALILLTSCLCGTATGQNALVADGILNMAPNDTTYRDYTIPNATDKPYLYLAVTGGDGGARHYKVLSTCLHGGGQGARVGGWYKMGNDGLKPGGTLRFIFGKKGTTTYQIDDGFSNVVAGGGGGGGTAVLYRPPGGTTWNILLVAGGGGGAASDGFCGGKTGKPGQTDTDGSNGTGIGFGKGGSNGAGGEHGEEGNGGGGWYHPGQGKCPRSTFQSTEEDLDGNIQYINYGGGFSGSGKAGAYSSHWVGGEGGLGNADYPDDGNNCKGYNFTGGYGFGGGGAGHGSGGGGGGYSGGGGGGLVGIGFGAGGGGGSFINRQFTIPFAKILSEQRSTTTTPSDGTIQYQFSASNPVATRDLGFEYHKGTEVRVLQAGAFFLLWQSDGNLVLYGPGFDYGAWTSHTDNKGTDLYFQGDGNLVVYQSGNPVFASNTANDQHGGKGGRKLVLTDDGHLFIVDQDGQVIWQGR